MVVTMTVDGQSEVVTEYTYSPSGALTTSDDTITVSYEGMTATVSITVEASQSQGIELTIVNNSSNDVEIYYDEDKEEKGNTTIQAGATLKVYPDEPFPYFIRYSEGGSTNSHTFNGTYKGETETNTTVNYYDGNVQPPQAIGSDTEWNFSEGDSGTLTISSAL